MNYRESRKDRKKCIQESQRNRRKICQVACSYLQQQFTLATVAATGYTPNQHSTISLTRYYLHLLFKEIECQLPVNIHVYLTMNEKVDKVPTYTKRFPSASKYIFRPTSLKERNLINMCLNDTKQTCVQKANKCTCVRKTQSTNILNETKLKCSKDTRHTCV